MSTSETAAVVALLNDIQALRRLRRLYPDDHPSLPAARERLQVRAQALATAESVTLGVAPDSFLWRGAVLPMQPSAPAARLLEYLFHLGIAALRLGFPQAGGGLARLAEILAELGDPPGEADRRRVLEAGEELTGIEILTIDVSKVELVDETSTDQAQGSSLVWADMLVQMIREGSLSLAGLTAESDLTPQGLAEMLESAPNAEAVLDFVFANLADDLRPTAAGRSEQRLVAARSFLAELVSRLPDDRLTPALVSAARRMDLLQEIEPGGPCLIDPGVVLDAVEALLAAEREVPEVLRHLLDRMLETDALHAPLPPRQRARAATLSLRAGTGVAPSDIAGAPPPHEPVPDWSDRGWAVSLVESMQDAQVRHHLLRVLVEVLSLWPGGAAADRAAARLGDELVDAIAAGDFEQAGRLAPALRTGYDPAVQHKVTLDVVRACARAFRQLDADHHPAVSSVLHALGHGAIPVVLEVAADASEMVVRKRLLEAVYQHGQDAIPNVRPLLSDERWFVVRNAVLLLRRLGDPELPATVKRRIPSATPQVLAEILMALAASGDREWLARILTEIDGPSSERAAAALGVAARIQRPEVARALGDRLVARIGKPLREPLTLQIVEALGRVKDAAALPALRRILDLRQWRYPFSLSALRREAAVAVASIDAPEARALVAELVNDRDKDVQSAVRSVLPAAPGGST